VAELLIALNIAVAGWVYAWRTRGTCPAYYRISAGPIIERVLVADVIAVQYDFTQARLRAYEEQTRRLLANLNNPSQRYWGVDA